MVLPYVIDMALIQIFLNENQDAKVEHYKIAKKLNTKQDAILMLIDELALDIQLPKVKKDGTRKG